MKIKKQRKSLTEEQKTVMLKNLTLGRTKAHETRRALEASAKITVPEPIPVPVPEPEPVPVPVAKTKKQNKTKNCISK